MGFKPQAWASKTLNAMNRELQEKRRVLTTITDFTPFTKGLQAEAYNGPKFSALTAKTIPVADADVNDPTKTAWNLPFDQEVGVPFFVRDIEQSQTNIDLLKELTTEAAQGLLNDADLAIVKAIIGGLETDATQRKVLVDSTNFVITKKDFQNARKYLNSVNAPTRGRTCLISPEHESQVYDIDGFISRDKISDTNALRDGVIGRLMGFDVVLYNDMPLVSTAGKIHATAANNVKNCTLFYQSLVCGYGRQKEIGAKVAPDAGAVKDLVNIYNVYGVKIMFPTYGYLVYDKAS